MAAGIPPATGRPHLAGAVAITGTIVAAVLCFLAAGALVAGYMVVRNRDVVEITNPADTAARSPSTTPAATTDGSGGDRRRPGAADRRRPWRRRRHRRRSRRPTRRRRTSSSPAPTTARASTPNSPYAPAFGDDETGRVGERSDTIMVLRVDPAAKRVAVLSFPRDLYVTIADTGNRGAHQLGLPSATTRSG